jgi:transcriptional regulator GlxA family with amidase domain
MTNTRNLAILIFPDVEVLDFCGPFEVFSLANRFVEPAPFRVFTVAKSPGPVITHNGLIVQPHFTMNDCPKPDILFLAA